MVREFQSVIGRETQTQLAERGIDPTALVACVGGGSNALGFFSPFLEADTPQLIGVEAGGRGSGYGEHAARMNGRGHPGIVHGYKSYFLLSEEGQVAPTHSISAGLDYPGIGPQLAQLGTTGRVSFTTASDHEALEAMQKLARSEGVIFALESAHGAAEALRLLPTLGPDEAVVVNMSGRGDKDLFISARELEPEEWAEFLEREAHEVRETARSADSGPGRGNQGGRS
jgi:tryptophan synthase beta chain